MIRAKKGESAPKTGELNTSIKIRYVGFLICSLLPANLAAMWLKDQTEPLTATASTAIAFEAAAVTSTTYVEPYVPPAPIMMEAIELVEQAPDLAVVTEPAAKAESVNLPHQRFISNNTDCAVQFGFSAEAEATRVQAIRFGFIEDLTDRDTYLLDGTTKARTRHAEGLAEAGELVSSPEEALRFVSQWTKQLCSDYRLPSQDPIPLLPAGTSE